MDGEFLVKRLRIATHHNEVNWGGKRLQKPQDSAHPAIGNAIARPPITTNK